MMYRSSIANPFHSAPMCGTSAQIATARYSRRSLLSTVYRKEPATIRPAIQGRKHPGIGIDQRLELTGRWRARAGQQHVGHAHPIEIGLMFGGGWFAQLAGAVALEIERHAPAARVQPHERLIVRRDYARVRQVFHD